MRDVKKKYMAMSTWKARIIRHRDKGQHTKSSLGRSYIAVPPPEGWSGGDPLKNGLKP